MSRCWLVGIVVAGVSCVCGAEMREDAEWLLRANILETLFPRIIDKEHGGFLCDFDWQWKPAGKHDKGIVYQARQTWIAAQIAMHRPKYREEFLEYTRHGLKFLNEVMWDKEAGGPVLPDDDEIVQALRVAPAPESAS